MHLEKRLSWLSYYKVNMAINSWTLGQLENHSEY